MSTESDNLAAGIQSFTEAVRYATTDPVDAIRALTTILLTAPRPPVGGFSAAQAGIVDLFRRAALNSIAMASADYQPASSTEANATIDQLAGLFDDEIIRAADAGELTSYEALRDMRQAVITDLRARAASLPELVTVSLGGNLPSLTLAYRLYGDATREPDLVARANVIHPGFMPPGFEALSA